jgi:hypothetical protein
MSVVDRAIVAAGLDGWLRRRLARDLTRPLASEDERFMDETIASIDLLVLGAIADRVRAAEVGDVVRLHLQRPSSGEGVVLVSDFDPAAGGHAFVRRVARARLLGSPGISVRIDVDAVGVEIAQVALAFGANELVVPMRRSIVTSEGDAVLRERELAGLVRAARRTPRVVEWLAGAPRERDVDATTEARRRFRAPGREARELRETREREDTQDTP